MLGPTDLSSATIHRVTTTIPVWTAETRSTNWFDVDGAALRIAGDLHIGARGLSVEEHTTRVLTQLLGERDIAA